MSSQESFCITARGMVGSPGHDSVTACAGARAGIVRTRALDYSVTADDGDIEHVVGHTAYPLTQGFDGDARLARLLERALSDLWSRSVAPPELPSFPMSAYVAIPPHDRCLTGLALVTKSSARKRREEAAARATHSQASERTRGVSILRTACRLAGRDVQWTNVEIAAAGHTAFSLCCSRAIEDLRANRTKVAVVGGVDSLLDEGTLQWLEDTGRLKGSRSPIGLRPGEAAALVELASVEVAAIRGVSPTAFLLGVHDALDDRSRLDGEHSEGKGVAKVMSELMANARSYKTHAPWLILDQNGEASRAADWGHALVQLATRNEAVFSSRLFYPALSFGDVGVASGAVGACIALGAFDRRWAPATVAGIVSCSDGRERSGILLRTL